MKLIEYQNPYWKDNQQYFLELIDLLRTYPKNGSYVHRLNANGKKKYPNIIPPYKHLRIWIENVTKQYDDQILDMTARVYWVLNGLTESPKCLNDKCNRRLDNKEFNVTRSVQPQYCSCKCVNESTLRLERSNETRRIRSKNDVDYWNKIEQKRKATKIKNGKDPNWNNSEKNIKTFKQHAKEDPDFINKIEQKRKQTKVKNGHNPNWHNEKQMIETRYEKNGGVWESEETIKRKEQSSLIKYGFKSPNSSDIVKRHKKEGCLRKFGVDSYSKTQMYHDQMIVVNEQRKAKEYETKKMRGTFNTSQPEERTYKFLIEQFGEDDVIRQYRSEIYPFSCDFYVKSLDLYIECNYSWTHGGHWFDENNEDDIAKLEKWKSKGTKYYKNAIETWIVRDIKKKIIVEQNKLNYIVIWEEDNEKLLLMINEFR